VRTSHFIEKILKCKTLKLCFLTAQCCRYGSGIQDPMLLTLGSGMAKIQIQDPGSDFRPQVTIFGVKNTLILCCGSGSGVF
jgi:hypothetical protein